MSLIDNWNQFATEQQEGPMAQEFWNEYFIKEMEMYKELLARKRAITGTIDDLAKKFGVDRVLMTGFIDGINDSLKKPLDLEALTEETPINLGFDKEKLYYNMVAAKADWLYSLEGWDNHLTVERRQELYKEQKNSKTVVNTEKVGRNDPCPCGSGKKFKKCCGR